MMSPSPQVEKKAADSRPPVIRDLRGARETATQRLLRKHIPAWVISGVLNVSLMGSLIALDRIMPPPAPPVFDEADLTVVAENEKEDAPEPNLVNDDIGLDPDLPTVVEAPTIDDVNVEANILTDDPGIEDVAEAPPIEIVPPPSVGAMGIDPGAILGELSNVAEGTTGGGSGVVSSPGFLGRGGASKSNLIESGGGNTASERAVAAGNSWLAKQQKDKTGAWVYTGDVIHRSKVIAATGMSLLPFLAAGQTHKPFKGNIYQKNVAKGLNFLLSQQNLATGQFYDSRKIVKGKLVLSDPVGMYDQAIATIAICEALGMTNDRRLLQIPAQKAIDFIKGAQQSDGSWWYTSTKNQLGDSSIVGWQIQALESAKLCKQLQVPEATIKQARAFLIKCSNDKLQATYGYKPDRDPTDSLTAVGLLCRYYLDGWGRRTPGMAAGVKFMLEKHLPNGKMDMYYFYYATQVMHFYGEEEWYKTWNPVMRDRLIKLQENKPGDNLGSWDGSNDPQIGVKCGRLGMTAMALLTLEVYYRHLPLYQRDTTGLKELDRLK